jgi:Flp pilus assembly pilin Flp
MLTNAMLRVIIAVQTVGNRSGGNRLRDEDGQTLAEYSLIISAIAVAAMTISVITFRGALVGAWNSASACLNGSC